MRILRFYVRQHLLLRDLDLHFDRPGRLDTGKYALDFLVGVNGSGKSTLLRAIVQVFVYLENGGRLPFEFQIEYELDNKALPFIVSVSEIKQTGKEYPVRTLKVTNKGSNEVIEEREIIDGSLLETKYLPKRKIVYSTGNENEWEKLFDTTGGKSTDEDVPSKLIEDSVQRTIKELPGSMAVSHEIQTDESEQPFWLMRNTRVPIMTLCGLLAHLTAQNQPLKDVIEAIGIQFIPGFSLRFRLHTALSDKEFYEKLAKYATCILRQGTDYLLYFDLTSRTELADEILKEFGSGFELYRALDELSTENHDTGQPTLQQVSIFLQRKSAPATGENPPERDTIPGLFLLDWLSDGEQSFLGRMAMLTMLDTDDSLIILDEPEVHFNDYWKREVVDLLDTVMNKHTNQLLITTHSSILLSDVTDDQITVLFKNEDGISQTRRPGIKTFGADPGEIMTVLFQTEIPSGIHATDLLTVAIKDGDKETVQGYLQMVGPGMWRFRLRQRLEEIDAPSN